MKRTRRMSIKVEHSEILVSLTQTLAPSESIAGTASAGEAAMPDHCLECGAPWLANLQDLISQYGLSADQLRSAVLENRLHLYGAPNGQIWICEQSLRQIKEKG